MEDASHVLMENNYISGAKRHSIYYSRAFRSLVINNRIYQSSGSGYSAIVVRLEPVESSSGVDRFQSSLGEAIIGGNIIEGETFGIEIVGDGSYSSSIIAGNVIRDSALDAILMITGRGSDGIVIIDNQIINSGGSGIFLFLSDFCNINRNFIKQSYGDGIYLRGVHNSIIWGNTIVDSGHRGGNKAGIVLTAYRDSSPIDNIISGNTVKEGSGSLVYGIRVLGTRNTVSNSYVNGAKIALDVMAGNYCYGN